MDLLLGLMPTQEALFLVQVPSASLAWWYSCKSQPGLKEQGIHPNPPCAKEQGLVLRGLTVSTCRSALAVTYS